MSIVSYLLQQQLPASIIIFTILTMTASDAFSTNVGTADGSSTSTAPITANNGYSCASGGGWSVHDVKTAEWLSVTQKERIMAVEGIMDPRPVKIKAELIKHTEATADVRTDVISDNVVDCGVKVISKIVHFQRHGQGYHNLLGSILRDAGMKLNHSSRDPKHNPWRRPEIVDSPLTEQGKMECYARKEQVSTLNPQLVVVSPMLRAIQTAKISFAMHENINIGSNNDDGSPNSIPWIAHEGCREELGFMVCNKRRPKSLIEQDYPTIDFSLLTEEHDALWDPDQRECPKAMSNRIYNFLVDFISQRSETEIAVICHSAMLFNMCTVLLDCGDDEYLASWFKTSEVRSMKLTFIFNNENDGDSSSNSKL